jgi:hypothetical protein
MRRRLPKHPCGRTCVPCARRHRINSISRPAIEFAPAWSRGEQRRSIRSEPSLSSKVAVRTGARALRNSLPAILKNRKDEISPRMSCLAGLYEDWWWKGLGADSEEKHEPVSDIDIPVVDSLKALDPERPIREADIARCSWHVANVPEHDIENPVRSRHHQARVAPPKC